MWNNSIVAVKVHNIPKEARCEAMELSLIREIELNCDLSHPHIIRFFGVATDDQDTIYIVSEYHHDGDIRRFTTTEKWIESSWEQKLEWIKKIAIDFGSAMQYLHQKNVLHRDLNPTNLLIEGKGRSSISVYLCDFGASINSDESFDNADFGSVYYMAPEIIQGDNYSTLSDVYSYGCVLWELITGKIPHEQFREVELRNRIKDREYDPISTLLSQLHEQIEEIKNQEISNYEILTTLIDIIEKCLQEPPDKRPSFQIINKILHRSFSGSI